MGRDEAKPVAGLQGGTAPARAFHDFMTVAVANRPVEPFDTQVPAPDWQLTPEEEVYGDTAIDANAVQPMVDENGMPIGVPPDSAYPQQPAIGGGDGSGAPTQQELDQAFPPQPPQQPRQPQFPRQPPPQAQPPRDQQSPAPPDPSEPRPFTT
jgi:penicillin-binding protein 1A